MFASGAAALVAGVRSPRRRAVETRRSSPYTAFRGLIRPGFGSGAVSVIRVNYLRLKHGGLGLGAGRSTATAGLGGAPRRRWSVPAPTAHLGYRN